MTKEKITLQRLRFCDLAFRAEPPDKRFSLESWEEKAELAYWKPESKGVPQARDQFKLARGASVSSDTFFNAFFIGHWRKLTSLASASLRLEFSGKFLLEVFSHDATGEAELLQSIEAGQGGKTEVEVVLAPEAFLTGIRFSFRLTSREDGSRLRQGSWQTEDRPAHQVGLSIGITTYNRQDFAERLIRKIIGDAGLRDEPIRVELIDQSDVSKLEHLNDSRCRVIRQENLGSSGGFTRGILESLRATDGGKPTHILLMDDDVEIETDSILRALRMAQFAKAPFILGGTQMDLFHPTYAYSMGETFQKDAYGYYDTFYALKNNLLYIDSALPNYMNAISLPYATDYCGWWFCMIPVAAILKVGLPVQFFVKGDDVEFGLRAKAAGILSHTVSGIGLWHPPPNTKSAAWIRYMDFYNHLILNTFYGYPEVVNLLQMQATWALEEISKHRYQNAAAMVRAMEDYLGGWAFYKNRTFPDYMVALKREVTGYEANAKGLPTIIPDQSSALRDRLSAVIARIKQDGKPAQTSLKDNLPKTTSKEVWERYFIDRNHSHLSD